MRIYKHRKSSLPFKFKYRIDGIRFSRVSFGGFYLTFLVVRHSKHFRCNGSYIPWIVSWTSFGFSFIEFEVLLLCGSFDKVLRLPNTFFCAPCSLALQLHSGLNVTFWNGWHRWIFYLEGSVYSFGHCFRWLPKTCRMISVLFVSKKVRYFGRRPKELRKVLQKTWTIAGLQLTSYN